MSEISGHVNATPHVNATTAPSGIESVSSKPSGKLSGLVMPAGPKFGASSFLAEFPPTTTSETSQGKEERVLTKVNRTNPASKKQSKKAGTNGSRANKTSGGGAAKKTSSPNKTAGVAGKKTRLANKTAGAVAKKIGPVNKTAGAAAKKTGPVNKTAGVAAKKAKLANKTAGAVAKKAGPAKKTAGVAAKNTGPANKTAGAANAIRRKNNAAAANSASSPYLWNGVQVLLGFVAFGFDAPNRDYALDPFRLALLFYARSTKNRPKLRKAISVHGRHVGIGSS